MTKLIQQNQSDLKKQSLMPPPPQQQQQQQQNQQKPTIIDISTNSSNINTISSPITSIPDPAGVDTNETEVSPLLPYPCGNMNNYTDETRLMVKSASESTKDDYWKPKINIFSSYLSKSYNTPLLVSDGVGRLKEFKSLFMDPLLYFHVVMFGLLNIIYGIIFGNYQKYSILE